MNPLQTGVFSHLFIFEYIFFYKMSHNKKWLQYKGSLANYMCQ